MWKQLLACPIILALAACGSLLPTQPNPTSIVTVVTVVVVATPEPASSPDAATPTLEAIIANTLPTDTSLPANTPVSQQPTATLVPLVANTIPRDNSYLDELFFETSANDPTVGNENGSGIANIFYRIIESQGRIVFEHTENNARYCTFGGGDSGEDCPRWRFSANNNTWPSGIAAINGGSYQLQVTINALSGQQAFETRNFILQFDNNTAPTPTLQPLQANSFPQGDTFGDELQFQTIANDPSVGSNNGAGIANVYFRIVDSQNNPVYERTEQNPLYCAFGGGDDLQNCPVWRFSENNNTWPSGVPVENGGSYRLEVTVNAKNGQTQYQELNFTIQLP